MRKVSGSALSSVVGSKVLGGIATWNDSSSGKEGWCIDKNESLGGIVCYQGNSCQSMH